MNKCDGLPTPCKTLKSLKLRRSGKRSFRQTFATSQHNIAPHYWAILVACIWPPCCDVVLHVGCCCLKFENGQIFHTTFVDVAGCCGRLARFVQQCCNRACALVHFSAPNMSQHVATGWQNCAQQCCDMLR